MKTVENICLSIPLIALIGIFSDSISHAQIPDAKGQCWFVEADSLKARDADLIVRTINTHKSAPHYFIRLLGIAQQFQDDWPYRIGVIAMQEVEDIMNQCKSSGKKVDGSRCFASILNHIFNLSTDSVYSKRHLGVMSGHPWEITGRDYWKIGGWFSDRFLLEVRLKHSVNAWHFRFYDVHLTSKKENSEIRLKQVKDIVRIVKERAEPGELPPVVVGDFNVFWFSDEKPSELSILEMEKFFYRPVDRTLQCRPRGRFQIGPDFILVGKKNVFRESVGKLVPIRTHDVAFDGRPTRVENYPDFFDELTDHHSQGISFLIRGFGGKSLQPVDKRIH